MTLPIFYYAQGTSWLFNELGITVSQALNDPYIEVFGQVVRQGAPTLPSHVKGLDGQIFPWDGAIPNDPFPLMLDTDLWQYKRVQYPASAIFIGNSFFYFNNGITAHLAPLVRDDIWRTLRLIADRGMAIVVVDKNLDDLKALCRRHVILVKGAVVFEGDTAELTACDDCAVGLQCE